MEQEGAVQDSSREVQGTQQREIELEAELERLKAELEAVSGDHQLLSERFKQLKSHSDGSQQAEAKLRQQIQSLQAQVASLQTQNSAPVTIGEDEGQSLKLQRFRAASAKQIEVLQLRYAKAESRIASLQTELEGKTQENVKLTQISDTLIAMLESSSLDA